MWSRVVKFSFGCLAASLMFFFVGRMFLDSRLFALAFAASLTLFFMSHVVGFSFFLLQIMFCQDPMFPWPCFARAVSLSMFCQDPLFPGPYSACWPAT